MSVIHITEATGGLPNSGRLSGTDGDLVGILDVGLPLNSWAVEFTTGLVRVYRPGSGNRFRLYVNDAAAVSGDARLSVVRGCENASAAAPASIVDPFPTVAKIADGFSNWLKSTTANTTARAFDIYIGATWVMFACNVGGVTNVWDFGMFGDCSPVLAGDPYATMCGVRNSNTTLVQASQLGPISVTNGVTGILGCNLARTFDGTVKSTTGGQWGPGSAGYAGQTGITQAQGGPSTGIDMIRSTHMDTGNATTTSSASLSLIERAYFPNLWVPLHAGHGAVNSRDTFTNTAYNASATFRVFTFLAAVGGGFLIIEETDTWSGP